MTLATEPVQVPETKAPAPSPPRKSPARIALGWFAVAAALGATAVLAVSALSPDSARRINTVRPIAEHGSVTAIDHRDQMTLARGDAAAHTVAEHGSVTAIDHRDQATLARRATNRTR